MPRLEEIQLELAGLCNAHCSYCTWQKRSVGKKLMDPELALRLVREAWDLGVSMVTYHGVGESLLHPRLLDIIELGERLVLNNRLSTNCYTLKGDLAAGLRTIHGLQMILAIPWIMPARFVEVCVDNAHNYLTSRPQNREVHLQMVCAEGCEPYYRRLVETFLPLVEKTPNARIHLKQPVTWPNDSPNKGFVNRELAGHPQVLLADYPTPVSIGRSCAMPERLLQILADGTVVPCCVGMDDWGVGNISQRSLKEIWESPELAAVRAKWKAKDDSIPCGKCLKRTDC